MTETPPSTAPTSARHRPDADPAAEGKPVPDRELLRRYVRQRDEAAFAMLVRRHSGLVIGVCRRVLRSEHDIEDAFQATFLVLARDAGRIRKSDSVASWLHGVAYRTSLRAADSSRRRGRLLRELTMIDDSNNNHDDGPLAQVEQRHQQQALDEELAALPDNYRAALVLHYLDGKSNQQVADELGLTITAVEGRLKRGRKELRLRLARRGIGLSVAVAAMQAAASTAPAAPLEPLITRAIDAGLSYAGGEAAGPVYTPEAARLAGQELITMSTTTAVTLATAILLPLTLGFAGHEPVANTSPDTGVVVNTMLAQAEVEVAEEDPFESGAFDPASGAGFDSFGGETPILEEEGDERETDGVSDVRVTTVHKTEDGEVVIIRYVKDGKQFQKVVRIDDVEELNIPEEFRRRPENENNMVAEESGGSSNRWSNAADVLVYADMAPNERRIREALEQQTQIEFVDTPLSDAIQFISHQHNFPILIDEQSLTEVGVPTDEPVNLILQDVSLQSALNHILRPLVLTTIIQDEVMRVTTTDVADEYLVTRVYTLRGLSGFPESQLIEAIETSLPDAEWKSDGGQGTASVLDGALIVKQTQSAHRQLADLLTQLHRHTESQQTSQTGRDSRLLTAPTPVNRLSPLPFSKIDRDSPRLPPERPDQSELTLAVDPEGVVSHDGKRLTTAQLVTLIKDRQTKQVQLRAARECPLTALHTLIDTLQAAGVTRFMFSTENRKSSTQDAPSKHRPGGQPGDSFRIPPPNAAEAPPPTVLKLRIDRAGDTWHAGREVSLEQIEGYLQEQQPTSAELDVAASAPSPATNRLVESLRASNVSQIWFASPTVDLDQSPTPASRPIPSRPESSLPTQ